MAGSLLPGGGPFRFLGGVALGHGPQVRLFAPPGNVDPNLVACPFGQRLGQFLTFTRIHGQQDLAGQDGTGQIILRRQRGEHLFFRFLDGRGEKLRFPSRQIAVLHVQHGITALAAAAVDAPDVGIGTKARDDGLFFRQRADGLDAVTNGRRLLKAQSLRFGFHFLLHLPQQLLGLAFQQLHRLSDATAVFLRRHGRAAEAVTAAHVEIQARPFRADIPREFSIAGRQTQRSQHGVQRLSGLKAAAEGAEIPRPVIRRAAHHGKAGIFFPRQADEGIALIIFQQDVIAGHMALDEGIFQHQRLKLAGDENRVEAVDL